MSFGHMTLSDWSGKFRAFTVEHGYGSVNDWVVDYSFCGYHYFGLICVKNVALWWWNMKVRLKLLAASIHTGSEFWS